MKKMIIFILMFSLGYLNANDRASIEIKVSNSVPIYTNYFKRVQNGYITKTRRIKVSCGNEYKDTNSIGLDTLLGIGAGVAIGNQIGKGRGKDAARVGGAIIGGYVANNMRGDNKICYEEEEYLVPKYEYINKRNITGWNNCGYIEGQKICSKSRYKKEYLKVVFYAE